MRRTSKKLLLAAVSMNLALLVSCRGTGPPPALFTPENVSAPSPSPEPAVGLDTGSIESSTEPWLVEVIIDRKEYIPGAVTVPAGSTITWTNRSDEQHSVISVDGLFNASVEIGGSFRYTFNEAGIYSYYCEVWSDMAGTIYVK